MHNTFKWPCWKQKNVSTIPFSLDFEWYHAMMYKLDSTEIGDSLQEALYDFFGKNWVDWYIMAKADFGGEVCFRYNLL